MKILDGISKILSRYYPLLAVIGKNFSRYCPLLAVISKILDGITENFSGY